MTLAQRYSAAEHEPRLQRRWAESGIYQFDPDDPRPIFAIDTPPPTVSGEIHIGHVFSYVQAEAMIRFWRMQGYNVYYPFGFDDNGLATERYVERALGIRAHEVGRERFIAACLEVSHETEGRFETFWKSLGMSVDWRLRYSTIDARARHTSQWSFLDLYRKGHIYRAQAPNPWCVECCTAIAQAEMEDAERASTFYTLAFGISNQPDGSTLPIATTRPELLPACVAVFVHPDDARYAGLIGGEAITPLFGRRVPILADPSVDPAKGTGAVMCCTFGDATDVTWWREHHLPLIPLVTRAGTLGAEGEAYAGLTLGAARERIVADMGAAGAILGEQATAQSVRVHERCGTPLEILETSQWFIRILDAKEALLEAGRRITWHPAYMHTRYEHWVANLSWDWCISRQRAYGVTFPLWHCNDCGGIVLADEAQLPLDPAETAPPRPCACGSTSLRPETDVMDTWATSSVSPQIAGQMLDNPALFERMFPMQLRPQAHDIIRTWAFYTIAKAHFHFGAIPWETLAISGHSLDPSGRKLSKSKSNAPVTPTALIERHSADAVRYWACGSSFGADQLLNEEAMRQGGRLVTKLWNAARFIEGRGPATGLDAPPSGLTPSDRAMLSWLQRLVERATASYKAYDYVGAREATERFFWGTLCDNYLELVKGRLYDGSPEEREAALYTLHTALRTVLKLLAPIMPHVTEALYGELYAEAGESIHVSAWPIPDAALLDAEAEQAGEAILAIATAARRYKSARGLGLGTELAQLTIAADGATAEALRASEADLRSVTRARAVAIAHEAGEGSEELGPGLWAGFEQMS